MDYIVYAVAALGAILSIIFSYKYGSVKKYLLITSLTGLIGLFALSIFGEAAGITMPINMSSLLLSVTGGVPGVLFALALTMIL